MTSFKPQAKNYKDEKVKEFCIKLLDEKFNEKFKLNDRNGREAIYGIDIIHESIPDYGAELEMGGWAGDFWETITYQWLPRTEDGKKFEFGLLNIPIRKKHFWEEEKDKGHDKNIFIRTNKDFTQFILIKPESIKNKSLLTKFIPNNNNVEESWMSFKKEDVETYNLKDNEWILT